MAHILSVSYDLALLQTRKLLLEGRGHLVVSGFGLQESLDHCGRGEFDLFILGHSIPTSDKQALIKTFRATCSAPILSLRRFDESDVQGVDYSVDPAPETVLSAVDNLLGPPSPPEAL